MERSGINPLYMPLPAFDFTATRIDEYHQRSYCCCKKRGERMSKTEFIERVSLFLVVLSVGYILVNLIVFNGVVVPFAKPNKELIIKEAVNARSLRGERHIVCKWVRVTGFNYTLVKDEYGKRTQKYILVSGVNLEQELTYEFLTAGNSFVFYVSEKREYLSDDFGECIEYIATDWDVLYPVRHDSPVTTIPKYVMKSDFREGFP